MLISLRKLFLFIKKKKKCSTAQKINQKGVSCGNKVDYSPGHFVLNKGIQCTKGALISHHSPRGVPRLATYIWVDYYFPNSASVR